MGNSAEVVIFGGFQCVVVSFRVAGVALRDIQTCSATWRKSVCVAGAILLRRFQKMCYSFRGRRSTLDVSIVIFRGTRSTLDVSCCMFCANRIGRAASSGDKVQIPWQSWHFVRCAENWRKPRTTARNIDFEVANFQVLRKTRRKTSILKLQSVKIGGSLARNARFDAPTCLVSRLWFSRGLAVSMGEAAKLVLLSCCQLWKLEEVSYEMLVFLHPRVLSRVAGFPVASPCLWGKLETSPFRMFPSRLSCCLAWQTWHFLTFQPVWWCSQNLKIGGSLVGNAGFFASTCLVASLSFSCGIAVSMGEAGKTCKTAMIKGLLRCSRFMQIPARMMVGIHTIEVTRLHQPQQAHVRHRHRLQHNISRLHRRVRIDNTLGRSCPRRLQRPVCLAAATNWCLHLAHRFELDCLLLSQASIQTQSCAAMASDGATLKKRMARTNQVGDSAARPSNHFPLLTPHSTLYTPHSTLYTPHFTLHTPYFTLHTSHSTLSTPHVTLHTLHSSLHTLQSSLYTLHSTLYTLYSTLYTLHSTLYTLHSTLHTLHFTLHTLHTTLYTFHSRPHTLHFTLHTPHFTLHTSHFTLHTPHFTLLTPHFTLLTLHSSLHTLHSSLHTPHFTLHTSHFPLHTPHFTLHTLHSSLHTLRFTLYTPHSTLYTTLHPTLHTLHFTLYTPRFPLYSPHSTLYTPHFTLHTLHFTLHTPHFTLRILHFTHSTLPTPHFALHTLHFPLHTADW